MIRLSNSEQKILSKLTGKKMTTRELADQIYGEDFYDAVNIVGNLLRRIRRKCAADERTDWTIIDETDDGGRVLIYSIGKKPKKVFKGE